MQISPQKEFVVVWNGSDPSDTGTLYVQAVVKDAKTRQILNTIALIDHGSQFFSQKFVTPADNSQTAVGRQILITITVYTDSGYTIPSQNYARETNSYIVKELIDTNRFYGVGWGNDGSGGVDYKKLEEMIARSIESQRMNSPVVLKQEFPIQAIIKAVREEIGKIPPYEKAEQVDFSSVNDRLAKVEDLIKKLPLPAKQTDITPLSSGIAGIALSLRSVRDELETIIKKESREMDARGAGKIDLTVLVASIVDALAQQIKDGKLPISVFGKDNPFALPQPINGKFNSAKNKALLRK